MKIGKAVKYEDEKKFVKKVNKYFAGDDEDKLYTISGLCLYLGISREELEGYEADEKFRSTVRMAKLIIENNIEEKALRGKVNASVSTFHLKNNFGWRDKVGSEQGGAGEENIRVEISD